MLLNILSLIVDNPSLYKSTSVTENFSTVKWEIDNVTLVLPPIEVFCERFESICKQLKNDDLQLQMSRNDRSLARIIVSSSVDQEDIETYYDSLSDIDSSDFKVYLTIDKATTPLPIYNLDAFVTYLDGLKLETLLTLFLRYQNPNNQVIFSLLEPVPPAYSNNIFFLPSATSLDSVDTPAPSLSGTLDTSCQLIGAKNIVSPHAFYFKAPPHCDALKRLFDKICTLLSLAYLSNRTELKNNGDIIYQVDGYRVLSFLYEHNSELCNMNVYDIYKWVYSIDNVTDKIALARNIISLQHISTIQEISDTIYASICSNYKIYLQENVEQYIETKNKITDILLDFSFKIRETHSLVSSNFKTALVANLSYIFTLIISNIINAEGSTLHLSREFSIIYIAINTFSLGYLIYSLVLAAIDIHEYKSIFQRIKHSYANLIAENDLENIFDKTYLQEDLRRLNIRLFVYSSFWIITIIISFQVLYLISPWFYETMELLINRYLQYTSYFIY